MWPAEMRKSGKPFSTLAEPFGPALPGVIGSVWVDFGGLIKTLFPRKVPSFIETCGKVLDGIGITGEMDKGTEIVTLLELEKGVPYRGKPVLTTFKYQKKEEPKPEPKPAAAMPASWAYTTAVDLQEPEKDLMKLYDEARSRGYTIKEIDGPFWVKDKQEKWVKSDGCKYGDGRIYINKKLSLARKAAVLAHEIEEDEKEPHTHNVQDRAIRLSRFLGLSDLALREVTEDLYRMQPLVYV